MDRFDIGEVYALHNAPGMPEGGFFTTPGPIMAAVDSFTINITGRGGHGAMPHETIDPVVAACGIVRPFRPSSAAITIQSMNWWCRSRRSTPGL